MRHFVLYSRNGKTSGPIRNLRQAGRLDTVYQCILSSVFLSHALRNDVIFHAILNGPPDPPRHLSVDGSLLHDVRVDEATWTDILNRVLTGSSHPGIEVRKEAFQNVIRNLAEDCSIFVLEERGHPVEEVDLTGDVAFVLGDHVGLPKAEESFALRFGKKVSLCRMRYLASTVITILNYIIDVQRPSA